MIERQAVNRMARQITCVGPNASMRQAVRLRIMTKKHNDMMTLMSSTILGVTQSNRTTHNSNMHNVIIFSMVAVWCSGNALVLIITQLLYIEPG